MTDAIDLEDESLEHVVSTIISINEDIQSAWSHAYGWAPYEAAELLATSRLDWLVSLSHCLTDYIEPFNEELREGKLILAYANLGALVEGAMKVLLCLYHHDYEKDQHRVFRNGQVVAPAALSFQNLRDFYNKVIWDTDEHDWFTWTELIQRRRNAIHAFQDRNIGDQEELHYNIRRYLVFLRYIIVHFPEEPDRRC